MAVTPATLLRRAVNPARHAGSPRTVLAVMCVGYFLVLLDVTIVNVALPAGPLLGGALVYVVGRRSVFPLNVPIVAVALVWAGRRGPLRVGRGARAGRAAGCAAPRQACRGEG